MDKGINKNVTSAENNLRPELIDMEDIKMSNNTLSCTKKGFQVCVYDFHKLPTPGDIYKIDEQDNMVAIRFTPGEVSQADKNKGSLIPIGMFNLQPDVEANGQLM